jgi:hypothetical protein
LELWIVFLFLAAICFVVGINVSRFAPKNRDVPPVKGGSVTSNRDDFQLDRASVVEQLEGLRHQPASVVSHTVEQVLQRWVINQDDKTAASRARFVKNKIEELKLMREGQQIIVDLEALALEREKRLKTLQLENAQLDDNISRRGERERLLALKEQKQLEFEIAEIEDRIVKLKNPPKAAPKLSPGKERAKRHAASEARLTKLKEKKQRALKIEDESERFLKVNAIDDEIQREMVEWSKTLP